MGNTVIKLSAYADDTYFFGQDPCSIQSVLATCHIFEKFSSRKLNLEKSHACWIGAAEYRLDTPIRCNWVNLTKDRILTLGVYNSYDVLLAEKYNFLNPISSVKDCLKTWKYRELTLGGRIQILNPISTGLFCLAVALGGGGWGVFHPPSITPLSSKLDCSNFVRRYFQIG